jgi:hypothetical protein
MKKILSILALAALTVTASAQQYNGETFWAQHVILPSTATNVPWASTAGLVSVTDFEDFAVTVSCSFSNPAACFNGDLASALLVCRAVFWPAVSATEICSNVVYTVPVACDTNLVHPRVTAGTNFVDYPYGYLKLAYVTNSLTKAHATNVVIQLWSKPRKREYR